MRAYDRCHRPRGATNSAEQETSNNTDGTGDIDIQAEGRSCMKSTSRKQASAEENFPLTAAWKPPPLTHFPRAIHLAGYPARFARTGRHLRQERQRAFRTENHDTEVQADRRPNWCLIKATEYRGSNTLSPRSTSRAPAHLPPSAQRPAPR